MIGGQRRGPWRYAGEAVSVLWVVIRMKLNGFSKLSPGHVARMLAFRGCLLRDS